MEEVRLPAGVMKEKINILNVAREVFGRIISDRFKKEAEGLMKRGML